MKPPYAHVGGMVASYEPPTIGVSTSASWLIVVFVWFVGCVLCSVHEITSKLLDKVA